MFATQNPEKMEKIVFVSKKCFFFLKNWTGHVNEQNLPTLPEFCRQRFKKVTQSLKKMKKTQFFLKKNDFAII